MRIADIQLQIQNTVKLTNAANIELTDIETMLLQSSDTHKKQIGGNLYSISQDLWNILHKDMEKQAHYIQTLLADKLDQYKEKGDKWVEKHIKMIQEAYQDIYKEAP